MQWPFGGWFNIAMVALALLLLALIPGMIVVSRVVQAVR